MRRRAPRRVVPGRGARRRAGRPPGRRARRGRGGCRSAWTRLWHRPVGVPASCEDSIGCMHGSSEPDLRNWKSPPPQFTQGARPDEHP
ncbi:hypothetical protein CBO47_15840 [Bordetella pertussis]|nr:hypothetical protein WU39_15895 [Bordetella pertussis]ASR59767.1 hypothetical protein CBO47_15840 [Bordetella pertussis]ASR63352.1 hypothetical protein CBO46_15495 [Bordetella pertussis]